MTDIRPSGPVKGATPLPSAARPPAPKPADAPPPPPAAADVKDTSRTKAPELEGRFDVPRKPVGRAPELPDEPEAMEVRPMYGLSPGVQAAMDAEEAARAASVLAPTTDPAPTSAGPSPITP